MNHQNKYGGYALVTGAASGIGLGFAVELARQSYDLVLVDMNEENLRIVAEELKASYPIKVETIIQDLSTMDASEKLYQKVKKMGLDIGLLVNNAGTGYTNTLDEVEVTSIEPYLHLMLVNYVLITRKFLPDMVKRGKGGLIYLSSIASEIDMLTLYAAAKAFVKHFAIGLSLDLKVKNIDVIAVGPGFVRTNFFAPLKDIDSKLHDQFTKISMTTPEAVAKETLENLGKKPFIVSGIMRDKILYQLYRLGPWPVKKLVLKLLHARETNIL